MGRSSYWGFTTLKGDASSVGAKFAATVSADGSAGPAGHAGSDIYAAAQRTNHQFAADFARRRREGGRGDRGDRNCGHSGLACFDPRTELNPIDQPADNHRPAVASIVDLVSRHVHELALIGTDELAAWLAALPVPAGWQIGRAENSPVNSPVQLFTVPIPLPAGTHAKSSICFASRAFPRTLSSGPMPTGLCARPAPMTSSSTPCKRQPARR